MVNLKTMNFYEGDIMGEVTVGIAHDYVQFEQGGAKVQIPIIEMPKILAKIRRSRWLSRKNIKIHAYEKRYKFAVTYWAQTEKRHSCKKGG